MPDQHDASQSHALSSRLLPDGKFTLDPHALPVETGEDPTEFYQTIDGADAADFQDFITTGTDVDCLLGNSDYTDLMDVLQTLGIDVLAASRYVNAIRRKPKGTFVEMYGQGRMVVTAHRRRRSLNLEGLAALIYVL